MTQSFAGAGALNLSGVTAPHKYAPLTNMASVDAAMTRAMERSVNLPGIVCVHGPPGYGKTVSASYVAANFDAAFIEAKSFYTPKSFLEQFGMEVGVADQGKTVARRAEQIIEALVQAPRPIIIDEADHIVKKSYVELIRDIYDSTDCPVMLVGEEHLPEKLHQWERVSSRILAFVQMQPATLDDAVQLRKHYNRGVVIADDLLEHFLTETRGITRRLVINLDRAAEVAKTEGAKEINLGDWGDRAVDTGQPRRFRSYSASA